MVLKFVHGSIVDPIWKIVVGSIMDSIWKTLARRDEEVIAQIRMQVKPMKVDFLDLLIFFYLISTYNSIDLGFIMMG